MIPAPATIAGTDRTSRLARLHPATRVALLPLAPVGCLMLPGPLAVALLLMLGWLLLRRGAGWAACSGALRVWWPLLLLVLVVHTLTRVQAAPLGQPSLAGLLAGLTSLARVAAAALVVVLLLSATGLADLVAGLAWWGRPWRVGGRQTGKLSLVLAVALGTVPVVLADGRRSEAVLRLRRGTPPAGRLRRVACRLQDRAHLAVPLVAALLRRAETLSLALQGRVPTAAPLAGPVPLRELLGLVLLATGLVFLVFA